MILDQFLLPSGNDTYRRKGCYVAHTVIRWDVVYRVASVLMQSAVGNLLHPFVSPVARPKIQRSSPVITFRY